MNANRCAWCGRWVSATTLPTSWRTRAGLIATRLLCPDDASYVSSHRAQVLAAIRVAAHPPGPPPDPAA